MTVEFIDRFTDKIVTYYINKNIYIYPRQTLVIRLRCRYRVDPQVIGRPTCAEVTKRSPKEFLLAE